MNNHLSIAHDYWKKHLHPGDVAIDATCGNGRDTEALARILLPEGLIIAMDLQQAAIDQTTARLKNSLPENWLPQVLFHRVCHSRLASIPLPMAPRLIVYNLGYLPGSGKSVTTKTATTMDSLKAAVSLLSDDGALSVTCYPGHPEGAIEELAVSEWARQLNARKWQVCHHRWINRENAPSLFWIVRLVDVEGSPHIGHHEKTAAK